MDDAEGNINVFIRVKNNGTINCSFGKAFLPNILTGRVDKGGLAPYFYIKSLSDFCLSSTGKNKSTSVFNNSSLCRV